MKVHSYRAIAGALGVSYGAAYGDVNMATDQDRSVALPAATVGLDGKRRQAASAIVPGSQHPWLALVNSPPHRMAGYSSFPAAGVQEVAERHRAEAKRLAVRVRTLEAVLELVVGMLAKRIETTTGGEA